jgi:hypothetical protein
VQIILDGGQPLRGDFVVRAVQRFDLTPIPAVLELIVRADESAAGRFNPGALIQAGSTLDRYRVIKVRKAATEQNQRAEGAADAREIIAVLEPFLAVSKPLPRAVFKEGASAGECLRACGYTGRVGADITLARFGVVAGDFPTPAIAQAMQEEAAACVWRSTGLLDFVRLPDLFQGRPVDSTVADSTVAVESDFLEQHLIPWALSVSPSGAIVRGRSDPPRAFVFLPRTGQRVLNNMTQALVVRRTLVSSFAGHIRAGDGIDIAGARHVVVTAAHVWESGNDGQTPTQATRLWLAQLHR